MTRLLLVSGRYLLENPYRELRLKTLFEERGIEVVFEYGLPYKLF